MNITYAHTNIIARDWRLLARFYERVFDCSFVPPERDQQGDWLARGTGVADAHIQGAHLRLPGHGPNGPTLEIYSYTAMEPKAAPAANRQGFGHLAFVVDDVPALLASVLASGGSALGEVVSREVVGVGLLTFVYVTDPEGNIIELQHWAT